MEVIKKYKRQFIFHIIINIIIGIFITFSSYYHLPLFYVKDYLMYGVHFLILQFTVFGFVYFLSLNTVIFNITFPIIFFLFSLISFWIYTQDISVSESLLQAIFETRIDIAVDLLSIQVGLYICLLFYIIYLIFKFRRNTKNNHLKSPLTLVALIAISVFFYMFLNGIGNLQWRMPYNLYFGVTKYLEKPKMELIPINKSLTANRDNINIVLILGESVRSKNLGLNNYYRNTTPLLKKQENLISYPNVFTPLTYTAISIPQIVTNQSIYNQNNFNKKFYSIYSILNNLNYTTTWIGNQSPEKSYSSFIKENDSVNLIDLKHGVFSFNKKLDEELLPFFKNNLNTEERKFTTIHMIGSHWWYENRYSNNFRKFKPTINSKHIPSLSSEQIINSYDNTILYLDYFLNEVINFCKKSDDKTIIFYLSDHGEILGEDGQWLHAQNNKASTNPAMLIWYSDEFRNSYPELIKNLKINSPSKLSTDILYHSILDMISIENFKYDKSQSIFNFNQ